MTKSCAKIKELQSLIWRRLFSLRLFFISSFTFFCLIGCQAPQEKGKNGLFVKQDPSSTNIGFINQIQETNSLGILDYLYFYNGAGVAAGDLNNDGYTDLYFVSNQGGNKLYLNNSNFTFKDISDEAGVEGFSDWQTGVTMADVNGDGWLDIYVCAVGGYKGLKGVNELYINNGLDINGQLSFTESAADYGLDFTGFSTQAAFFDYDKDGDLDMYLLNHAVHTSKSYERASNRNIPDKKSGDYLFENQLVSSGETMGNGTALKFKDVTQEAGIFQAVMGYGLGVVVADFNNDGWDDIYVANDFHEDDYYYVNQGDGTFLELGKDKFKHFSRFSMGCDAADMNNDGFLDLVTVDMYPKDEIVLKSSVGEDPFDIFNYKLRRGYFYQYSRNCLQLNLSGENFTDVGIMAGVSATDWSWSPLIADYDNDGIKDLFIANGIMRRPNDLDYIRFVSSAYSQQGQEVSRTLDEQAIALMPDGKVHNYLFKGSGNLKMEDKSLEWGFGTPSLSNGAVYADLDNDGDLDLVTNNINEPAGIYRNMAESLTKNNYLKIHLHGQGGNTYGVGAKVIIKYKGEVQIQQLMPTRGFLSSVEPVLNFGLGSQPEIDTLIVLWGNNKMEIKEHVQANTVLNLKQEEALEITNSLNDMIFNKQPPLFEEVTNLYSIEYMHQENEYLDFNREPLIPFLLSTEGPKLAIGDVNGDGKEDFYVGGAKGQAGKLFIQQKGSTFASSNEVVFEGDLLYEDTDAVFFDADGDGDLDLYVVSGGNEIYGKQKELLDRLYLNDGSGNFKRTQNSLPPMYTNKSTVKPFDFDQDGDLDLFVGGRVKGAKYGLVPDSYLLINDGKGIFTDQTDLLAPSLRKSGMVTDAQWVDYDNDGDADLIVVGDWMPIKIFENINSRLKEVKSGTGLENSNGLWQTLEAADFDMDGDMDLVAGNIGINTKLKKGGNALKMFVKDLDENGTLEQIIAYQVEGNWYPVATRDELGRQMPFIKKKFYNYKSFAGKTLEEVFDEGELEGANEMSVNQFQSLYLENLGDGRFKQHTLPEEVQISKIFAFHVQDIDGDGHFDLLLGGNFHGVSMYQGRYDASYGLLLKGDGKGNFQAIQGVDNGMILDGEVRDIKSIKMPGADVFLVTRNNFPMQIFKMK